MKRGRIPYSAKELAWLEANRFMVMSDYAAAFNAKFGRDLTPEHLKSLRVRMGWRVGRAGFAAKMKGASKAYTPAEIAWLEENKALPIKEYTDRFNAAFGRDVHEGKLHALRKRRGWRTGRTGQFVKGQESHNKGKKMPPGVGGNHPNARKTQFKKGQLPHNTKYLGHERVNVDGYVEISVDQRNPHTGYERRYVLKHLWLWEQKNGPVPKGHCLKCLDGNRLNTAPSNWEPIPRSMLPRLVRGKWGQGFNYDSAPDELKPAIMATAKLKHAVREKRKGRA
jgi:hypothetical protein